MSDTSCSRRPRDGGADHHRSSPLDALRRWLRHRLREDPAEDSLRAAIEELIEEPGEAGATVTRDERMLLTNILNVRNITVEDVMVPRADIVAVEAGTSLTDLAARMSKEAHSRVPVYRETLDDVIGMVHIKDVLAWIGSGKPFKLSAIMRKVLFASPSMRVLDLLLEMRVTRVHMALVVDEYGGIDGLVTIEDLVEEIVGEIEDEHDVREAPVLIERPDGVIDASARVTIEDFEARIGPILSEAERQEDIDTLGGLVFALAGRVPGRGEVVTHPSGWEFAVLDADPRRIRRLRIHRPAAVRPAGDGPAEDKAAGDGAAGDGAAGDGSGKDKASRGKARRGKAPRGKAPRDKAGKDAAG